MFDGLLQWIFSKKITSYKRIHDEFIQRFFKYYAEVLKEMEKPGAGFESVIPGFENTFQFELPNLEEIDKNYPKEEKHKAIQFGEKKDEL